MNESDPGHIFPTPINGLSSPFYYAALNSLFLYYQVDAARVARHLEGTGLRAALFDGMALANLDVQRYLASYNVALGETVEVEFNVVAYPAARAVQAPKISLKEYLGGQEQTKTFGNYRLHVACDNKMAVKAGRELYGEAKFYTTFTYNVPDLNAPEVSTWQFTCNDPHDAKLAIFNLETDLANLPAKAVSMSPIVDYSMLKLHGAQPRLNQSWRNLLGYFQMYDTTARAGAVKLDYGESETRMRRDMQEIIRAAPCVAAQWFVSPPACIEGRGFFVES
ncbi:MAG TPA: hypothetical protein VFR86_25080 [Burkholderiaceae bacterium]|nr:hypothetical protein [Burkholderiaceae bacterium]